MTSFLLSHFRRSGWPVKPFLESLLKVPGNIYVLLSENMLTHTIVINITVHSQNELEDMEKELTCCVLLSGRRGGGCGIVRTVDCFSSPRSIIHCSAISSFELILAWFYVSKSLHIVLCTLAYMKFCKIKSWDVVKKN